MKQLFKSLSLFLLVGMSLQVNAQNDLLVKYDFNATATNPATADYVTDYMRSVPITSPMDVEFISTIGDTENPIPGALAIGVNDAKYTTFDQAIANDNYITFSVNPSGGRRFLLKELTFKATKKTDNSVDEYAVTDSNGTIIGIPVAITQNVGLTGAYDEVTFDMTSSTYNEIRANTEIRIYAWGRGSENLTNTLAAIDNIELYGEVTVNASGRNSSFWVSLKPNAGTVDAIDSDLTLNNGYRLINLSSPSLSCTRIIEDSKFIYRITWKGNSILEGTRFAENVQFDIVVEAFTDATYTYSATENSSSVTALGNISTLFIGENQLGVGTDNGLDPGESIKVSQENFLVDGSELSVNDLELKANVFSSVQVSENNGGNSHKIIFDTGSNLRSITFSNASRTYTIEDNSFSVTGAGSNTANREWAIAKLNFEFNIFNPEFTDEDTRNPFSDLEDGYTFGQTAYEPTSRTKLNQAYPKFSWDRISRTTLIRKGIAYTDEEIERMANLHDVVVLEKANAAGMGSVFLGMRSTATRLKAINPDIKVLAYWNSYLFFGTYGIDDEFKDEYINPDVLVRETVRTYDVDNPEFIEWWVNACLKMMGLIDGTSPDGTLYQTSDIDGVFIDKARLPLEMLIPLYQATPDNKFIMNNNGEGNRNRLPYLDGTYREGFIGDGDYDTANTIALAQESGANKKLTMLRHIQHNSTSERDMESRVDFALSLYLTYAEEYGYFFHQGSVDATDSHFQWLTDYYDQNKRPLGKPLYKARKNDWFYSRSYEHADAYLDLNTDGNGSNKGRVLWKNNIGDSSIEGSGYSNEDKSYTLKSAGDISGTSDNMFFMSDLHYGDGEISAKVDALTNTHNHAKAGVMFRQRNEPDNIDDYVTEYAEGNVLLADAPMVAVIRNPNGNMRLVYRATSGGKFVSTGPFKEGPYAKITRSGDLFTGYYSSDGISWTEIGEVTIAMGERVEAGMAVGSQNKNTEAEATFSDFTHIEDDRSLEELTNAAKSIDAIEVDDVINVDDVILYPNPVSSELNITLETDSELKIYDINGKIIMLKTVTLGTDIISVENLPNGMYLVQIESGTKFYTKKIIKQ